MNEDKKLEQSPASRSRVEGGHGDKDSAILPLLIAPAPLTDKKDAKTSALEAVLLAAKWWEHNQDSPKSALGHFMNAAKVAFDALAAPQQSELSEAQISAAGRALADRSADSCGVNRDDNWMIYGSEFIEDARVAFAAAAKAAPAAPVPEWFKYDAESDVAEIYGMKYSRALFEEFAGTLPLDAAFKVTKRDNGVLCLMRVSEQADPVQTAEQASLPDGWTLVRGGDDIQLRRADGKWCGYSLDIDSPAHRLTHEFLAALLSASVAAPVQAEQAQAEPADDDKYAVIVDRRDLFDALRSAWREGSSVGWTDTAESWHKATDYAENEIKGWKTMRALPAQAEQVAAVRAAALEEAARVCEWQTDPTRPNTTSGYAMWHAKAIRALIAPSTGEAKGESK